MSLGLTLLCETCSMNSQTALHAASQVSAAGRSASGRTKVSISASFSARLSPLFQSLGGRTSTNFKYKFAFMLYAYFWLRNTYYFKIGAKRPNPKKTSNCTPCFRFISSTPTYQDGWQQTRGEARTPASSPGERPPLPCAPPGGYTEPPVSPPAGQAVLSVCVLPSLGRPVGRSHW